MGFAFFSIVSWLLNWFCWRRKLCCFQIFDFQSNRIFVWWLSWVFLCGILACCIAGFVSANRLGFALNGIQCAYERIYYDSVNGQMKITYPRWMGSNQAQETYKHFNNIYNNFSNVEAAKKADLSNSFFFRETEIENYTLKNDFDYPVPSKFALAINLTNTIGSLLH